MPEKLYMIKEKTESGSRYRTVKAVTILDAAYLAQWLCPLNNIVLIELYDDSYKDVDIYDESKPSVPIPNPIF